jgi:hypothetical protein
MSTKGKTYNIDKLSQICDIVNDDNIELLINDFAGWLIYYNGLMTNVRKENPDLEKIPNSKIAGCNFLWTDDGKNELTGVIVKNKKTGETTTTRFDKK